MHTLTWNRYSDHLREMVNEMMTSSQFADVTLVTDDKQLIRAHRNILGACSPVFKNILNLDSSIANPVIYLRGIQNSEMVSIMQFIYQGKVSFKVHLLVTKMKWTIFLLNELQSSQNFFSFLCRQVKIESFKRSFGMKEFFLSMYLCRL